MPETQTIEDRHVLKFIDCYISILTEMWKADTTNINIKTDYFYNLGKPILKYKGKGNIFIMRNLIMLEQATKRT